MIEAWTTPAKREGIKIVYGARAYKLVVGGNLVNPSTYELSDTDGQVTLLRQKEVVLLKLLSDREALGKIHMPKDCSAASGEFAWTMSSY